MTIQQPVWVGVDPHADTITAAAVDHLGTVLWDATVDNTVDAITGLIGRTNGSTRWAVEGSGALGRLLTDTLLSRQATVVEVPTRFTARMRLRNGYAKTDRLDAMAIARLALTEHLPPVSHHPVIEALRVLWGQRETHVRARTQAANRIRARLRELDPDTVRQLGRLRSKSTYEQLVTLETTSTDPHHQALVLAIRIDAQQALNHIDHIKQLDTHIRTVMPPAGKALMSIQGISHTTAAAILAHTGDIRRFPTDNHYARHAGTAPLDTSSGRHQRHRLNRWGNRQLNRAIHTAIVTQLQQHGDAWHYITNKTSQGKTSREATRAAKRHLTRRIYRTLKAHPLT